MAKWRVGSMTFPLIRGLDFTTSAANLSRKKLTNSILHMRNRHFFVLDVLALLFIPALSLTLRLDGLDWWPYSGPALALYIVVALLIRLPIFYGLGLYDRYWRYAGVSELYPVLISVGASSIALTALFAGAYPTLEPYGLAMYRFVPLIDGLLTGLAVGGTRFGLRGIYHWRHQHKHVVGGRRVLVVGAGEAGTMVVREMRANPQLEMEPVAFVDDDPAKVGIHIQGLPVLGISQDISELVDRYQIQRIVVAIPSAPLEKQRKILAMCKTTGVATQNLPGIYEILAGHKTLRAYPGSVPVMGR